MDDFSTDMEDFGILVKKMLQIYHSRLKYSYSFDSRKNDNDDEENMNENLNENSKENTATDSAKENGQTNENKDEKSADANLEVQETSQDTELNHRENGYHIVNINHNNQIDIENEDDDSSNNQLFKRNVNRKIDSNEQLKEAETTA